MTQATRGDDERLFGPGGKVRATMLFARWHGRYPGVRVIDGGGTSRDARMEALHDELARLLGKADALEPASATAQRIAAIDGELAQLEEDEASKIAAAFEDELLLPLHAGRDFKKELADVLARIPGATGSPDPAGPAGPAGPADPDADDSSGADG